MQCPRCSQIAFGFKSKFTNLIRRSQFVQFYYFVENITKVKSTDFKVPRTDFPWYLFQSVVYIQLSYVAKTILQEGFGPRRHHGIAPLDKCHYNFLVPLLWLKFSRILLWITEISLIHSVLHQIKGQYTGFLLLQTWAETRQLICSHLVHFSIPSMHKPVSTE